MAKTDFERTADQLRDQFEDLKSAFEDWLGSAQAQMSRTSRHTQRTLRAAREEVAESGLPWWVPVAVVAAIGIAIAIANMVGMFGAREGEETREEFRSTMAGTMPPFGTPGQP